MRLLAFSVLSVLCVSLHSANTESFRSDRDVARHMFKYATKTQTSAEISEFKKIIQILTFPSFIYRQSLSSFRIGRQSLTCLTCRSVVSTVVKMYHDGYSQEEIADVMVNLCTLLEIEPGPVCRGLIDMNAPIFLYILENQPLFTPDAFCGVVFQTQNKNSCPFVDPRYQWSLDIPEKKAVNKISSPKDDSTFKLVHITDIHFDPVYEADGEAECDEPTCCRAGQKPKSRHPRSLSDDFIPENHVYTGEDNLIYVDLDYAKEAVDRRNRQGKNEMNNKAEDKKAGYWGDYRNCDTPWWAYEDAMDFISENHPADYIYYTGDTIDHGVWETSKELITDSLNSTLNKFKSAFKDTPIFPSIGNHESQPLNQYAPPSVTDPEVSTAWLYELLSEKWGMWLPEDTKETIQIGGYYTVLVKPGFRVIVLNSNLCYVYNWWIHLEPEDPSGQLKWLVDTLLEAESAGEKVHILSHIPNGITDIYSTCSTQYKRIIERFSDTITAQFNGHTHKDEFKVFYAKNDNSKPINVAWNGGSITPYSNVNSNYRVFEIDAETLDVVDFDTWIYNLTEANLTPEKRPNWYKEYSFKQFYNVDSLSPIDVDKLVQRMVTSEKELLAVDYHAFRGKYAENWHGTCSESCVKNNLCYIVTSELYDDAKCQSLWQVYNQTYKN